MTAFTNSSADEPAYVWAGSSVRLQLLKASIRMSAMASTQKDNVILLTGPVDQHVQAIRRVRGLTLVTPQTPRTWKTPDGITLVSAEYHLETTSVTFNTAFDSLFKSQEGQ